jgi:hypothetical protein
MHDIAYHLLTEVYDALTECYPSDCVTPLRAYVTFGDNDDGVVDALTVSAGSITSSANSRPGGYGLYRMTYNIKLIESGWPTARIEGETIIPPPPEESAAAAKHVFAMGEAMHRRLAYLTTHKALTPPSVRCSNAAAGTMAPIPPSGGTIGWRVPVLVDLPWN